MIVQDSHMFLNLEGENLGVESTQISKLNRPLVRPWTKDFEFKNKVIWQPLGIHRNLSILSAI